LESVKIVKKILQKKLFTKREQIILLFIFQHCGQKPWVLLF